MVDQARETAGQVADQAREQASSQVDSQKDRAVEMLGHLAQAVRQTGQELRQQDQPALAGYVDRTAQAVERCAGYLRARDTGQLLDEGERLARRHPAVFLGGSFAQGHGLRRAAILAVSVAIGAQAGARLSVRMSGRLIEAVLAASLGLLALRLAVAAI